MTASGRFRLNNGPQILSTNTSRKRFFALGELCSIFFTPYESFFFFFAILGAILAQMRIHDSEYSTTNHTLFPYTHSNICTTILLLPQPTLLNSLNMCMYYPLSSPICFMVVLYLQCLFHLIAIPHSLPFNSHLDFILGVTIYLMLTTHPYVDLSLEIFLIYLKFICQYFP